MYKNKSQHYNFAFEALPTLFFSQTNDFVKYLDRDGLKFLKFWWDHVGDKMPEEKRISASGMSYEVEDLDEKNRLITVIFPSPREDGEAYFIGMIPKPERRFAMVRLHNASMFVLRRDDHVTQPHHTSFGELTPNAQYRERGVGLNPTKQDFKRIIKNRLEKKK